MSRINYKFQTIILFIILITIGGIFHGVFFKQDIDTIKKQTQYLFEVEDKRLKKYLSNYNRVLVHYKKEMESLDGFDKAKFEKMSESFLAHFKDTQAVNFVDENLVIRNVNPKKGNQAALNKDLNKHPDPLIKSFFNRGVSKTETTFVPPVRIYQGGMAVILYAPLTFKTGRYAWINVVILSNKLFQNYKRGLGFFDFDFSVVDKASGRSFLGKGSTDTHEWGHLKFEAQLMGRDIIYHFDLTKQFEAQMYKSLTNFISFFILSLILCFLFFLYSKSREKIYNQLINIKNESNLLKILVHDISNPIQVVSLGLQTMDMEQKLKPALLKNLLNNQNIVAEVIHSIRMIFKDQIRSNETQVNLKNLTEEILLVHEEYLKRAGLKIRYEFDENSGSFVKTKINEKILKNHIIRNILSNSIKFSHHNSELLIRISKNHYGVYNQYSKLSSKKIEELNKVKPQESTLDEDNKSSLGLGMFIVKIFCHYAQINFAISQDEKSGVVATELTFS